MEADIACDPVRLLPICSEVVSKSKRLEGKGETGNHQTKGHVFNTIQGDKLCLFCNQGNHIVGNCFKLQKQSAYQKVEFVMKHSLCFGCLEKGHTSRECENWLKCKECLKSHPTSLHNKLIKESKPAGFMGVQQSTNSE